MQRLLLILLLSYIICHLSSVPVRAEWSMPGANPQRTSWQTPAEPDVSGSLGNGNLNVEWYVPIEPYIDQKVQLITANDKVYVSTAKGLYVFNYQNGQVAWRFDTELPLGHSPTVIGTKVYVAGHDKRVYRLQDYGTSYQVDWIFDEATSGYNTNPLVVNNTVYIGNRSGVFYALDANTGSKRWQYPSAGSAPLGAIKYSPAYDSATNTVYFAAADNRAYAIDANPASLPDNQRLKWSTQLLGDGFTSYWPVVTGNYVIYSGAASYMEDFVPGSRSALASSQQIPMDRVSNMQVWDVFQVRKDGATWYDDLTGDTGVDQTRLVGDQVPSRNWINGQNITYIRPWRMLEYYETGPADIYHHKPWRREIFVINKTTGQEFTFDSDADGQSEYAPFSHWNAGSGNKFPVLVDPNGIIYTHSLYRCCSDSKGQLFTWNPADPGYMGIVGNPNVHLGAVAEPQGFSGNGTTVYHTICCDRALTKISTLNGGEATIKAYGGNQGYNQITAGTPPTVYPIAPGYDSNWMIWNGIDRLIGFYQGPEDRYINAITDQNGKDIKSVNGIYHNHGSEQNPPIAYKGKLFIHRSNAILAIGPGPKLTPNNPPTLRSNPPSPQGMVTRTLSDAQIQQLLDQELQKITTAGIMRPGYSVLSQWYSTFADYAYPFQNPGDTLYTLSLAYPHASPGLQTAVADLANTYYQQFFVSATVSKLGWTGAKREAMPDPPEFATGLPGNTTGFPFENIYALWLYAQNILIPRGASNAELQALYNLAANRMATAPQVTYSSTTPSTLHQTLNGYIGFIKLHELAQSRGLTVNANHYATATSRLSSGITLRQQNWSKDNGFFDPAKGLTQSNRIALSVAANFMYLTPELGHQLNGLITQAQTALTEYEQVAPFWFVSKFESFKQEGTIQPIFTAQSLFQARAYILNQPKQELSKYIDTPYYNRGDLYYLQNLVAILEAPSDPNYTPPPQPSNTPVPPPPTFDFADLWDRLLAFGTNDQNLNLVGTTSLIDIFDLNYIFRNL